MSDHVSSPTKTTHDSRGPGILERTNACARRLGLDRTIMADDMKLFGFSLSLKYHF